MILGDLVETLIRVHDSSWISRSEDDAVCAACNILDCLPRQMTVEEAQAALTALKGKQ